MSVQNVLNFLEKISQDLTLHQQLEKISNAEQLINFASQQGYKASEQDFIQATLQLERETSDELSSSQLTVIAGGINSSQNIFAYLSNLLNVNSTKPKNP